jgi:hypothetical protein
MGISDSDSAKLSTWNWGAFFLAPLWAFTNRLELWAVLCFVPFVNIVVALYLGYRGNRLAYSKSRVTVDEFVIIQKHWNRWGIRVFWLAVLFLSLELAF